MSLEVSVSFSGHSQEVEVIFTKLHAHFSQMKQLNGNMERRFFFLPLIWNT